ncbi:MAG: hypothetical protein WC716_02330 [Chitinophagaceae bacterium]|jgi:hypothetical protein
MEFEFAAVLKMDNVDVSGNQGSHLAPIHISVKIRCIISGRYCMDEPVDRRGILIACL